MEEASSRKIDMVIAKADIGELLMYVCVDMMRVCTGNGKTIARKVIATYTSSHSGAVAVCLS